MCQQLVSVELHFLETEKEWVLELQAPARVYHLKSPKGGAAGRTEIRTWYASIREHVEKTGRPKSQLDADRREIEKGNGLPLTLNDLADNMNDQLRGALLKGRLHAMKYVMKMIRSVAFRRAVEAWKYGAGVPKPVIFSPIPSVSDVPKGLCSAIWEYEHPETGEWCMYNEAVIANLEKACKLKHSQIGPLEISNEKLSSAGVHQALIDIAGRKHVILAAMNGRDKGLVGQNVRLRRRAATLEYNLVMHSNPIDGGQWFFEEGGGGD